MFQTLRWEIRNGIAWLTLNQPPSNRMTTLFFDELSALMRDILPAADFDALIVHGAGRHFSSGADLDGLLTRIDESGDGPEIPQFLVENKQHFRRIHELSVPVIAAVQGVCLGSGLELALNCHFRICAEGALLGLPEVTFNLMPGCGGTQIISQLVSRDVALSCLLEGRNLDPAEALQAGVVDHLVPRKALLNYCENLAYRLAPGYHREKKEYYCRHLLNTECYE